MSKQEAAAFVNDGRNWLAKVWIGKDDGYRDTLINGMNEVFEKADFKIRIGRGWQPYDPVVRVNGSPHTYASLVTWASQQADGGVDVADTFLDWATGTTRLTELSAHLQALAVITHFAEVARGYEAALGSLYSMMQAVKNAGDAAASRAVWVNFNVHFAPSLKYAEDAATEYMET